MVNGCNRACLGLTVTDMPIWLRSISLQVGVGRLVAVVGSVGAGKSSLMNCILGEMMKTSGKVSMKVGLVCLCACV